MELGEIDPMLREMREKRDHADTMLKLAEADAQRCADMGTGGDDIVWRYAAVLAEQVEMVRVAHSRVLAGIDRVMRAIIETAPYQADDGRDRYDEWMRTYFPGVEEAAE
jgi:hypothetical protein